MTFVFAVIATSAHSEVYGKDMLIITGFYTGKNIYVQNPYIPDSGYFSTEQVFVNENLVLTNPLTSAFTVDLSHLDIDQSVEVRIVHKRRFPPRIINAYVIRKVQVEETTYAAVKDVFRWSKADRSAIRWLTDSEKGGGTFELQKATKEQWKTIQSIASKPQEDGALYHLPITHEPGENTYRIKLVDREGYVTYSPKIHFNFRQ